MFKEIQLVAKPDSLLSPSLESDAPTICVIRSLVNYLLEDSVETSNASAQALKHILYTTRAHQDIEKFERALSMKGRGGGANQISLLTHPFKNAMTKGVYDYNAIAGMANDGKHLYFTC